MGRAEGGISILGDKESGQTIISTGNSEYTISPSVDKRESAMHLVRHDARDPEQLRAQAKASFDSAAKATKGGSRLKRLELKS